MPHWNDRPEPTWKQVRFNQPYAKGLARLREQVLSRPDFDPVVLWQWGTMQAMAVIEILKECEGELGSRGQELVARALERVGRDVGRQILEGSSWPAGLSDAEFCSYYATIINRIAYASLEAPRIDSANQVSFDILWCPHQDHYGPFDCRVQRYFVQGMIEAAREHAGRFGFEVRFDATIPAGAEACRFTLWRATDEEREGWRKATRTMEERALRAARYPSPAPKTGEPEG